MVRSSSLSRDRKWPAVDKCTHSRVVGLRLIEGNRDLLWINLTLLTYCVCGYFTCIIIYRCLALACSSLASMLRSLAVSQSLLAFTKSFMYWLSSCLDSCFSVKVCLIKCLDSITDCSLQITSVLTVLYMPSASAYVDVIHIPNALSA